MNPRGGAGERRRHARYGAGETVADRLRLIVPQRDRPIAGREEHHVGAGGAHQRAKDDVVGDAVARRAAERARHRGMGHDGHADLWVPGQRLQRPVPVGQHVEQEARRAPSRQVAGALDDLTGAPRQVDRVECLVPRRGLDIAGRFQAALQPALGGADLQIGQDLVVLHHVGATLRLLSEHGGEVVGREPDAGLEDRHHQRTVHDAQQPPQSFDPEPRAGQAGREPRRQLEVRQPYRAVHADLAEDHHQQRRHVALGVLRGIADGDLGGVHAVADGGLARGEHAAPVAFQSLQPAALRRRPRIGRLPQGNSQRLLLGVKRLGRRDDVGRADEIGHLASRRRRNGERRSGYDSR